MSFNSNYSLSILNSLYSKYIELQNYTYSIVFQNEFLFYNQPGKIVCDNLLINNKSLCEECEFPIISNF
jgi:hypothetical protein